MAVFRVLVIGSLGAFGTVWCAAQTGAAALPAPDTPSMIEALRPTATRGMRNLLVRQRPEATAGAASGAVPAAPAASATAEAPAPAQPAPAVAAVAAPAPAPGGPPPSLSLAIQFESNSSRVRPESGAVLGNLVAALQSPELKTNRFAIEGHTDAAGQPARNLALSQERADEVRLFLVALGVHPSRLKAVGKGASDLVNPLNPLAAENRRVRVVTLE